MLGLAALPYTTVSGKVGKLLSKIQDVGAPKGKMGTDWLAKAGFIKKSDGSLVSVLKALGFVDQAGNVTPRWNQYRNTDMAPKVLAEAVREAYSSFFDIYPDAFRRSDEELKNIIISEKPEIQARATQAIISTFKALCERADFSDIDSTSIEVAAGSSSGNTRERLQVGDIPEVRAAAKTGAALVLNVNIQLTVPETTDESVYDKFFAALRKHLLAE